MVKVVGSVRGGSRRVADRTERAPRCAVGVVCVVVHGCAWETRCLPPRISTTRHCIICHDTKPHDRVRSKQHTSTRHAKACHSTAWFYTSAHAPYCRDNSMAEQGRYAPKESATPTLFGWTLGQSVGSVRWLPSFVFAAHISQGERHRHQD